MAIAGLTWRSQQAARIYVSSARSAKRAMLLVARLPKSSAWAKNSNSWFRSRDFRVSQSKYEPCTLPLRQVAIAAAARQCQWTANLAAPLLGQPPRTTLVCASARQTTDESSEESVRAELPEQRVPSWSRSRSRSPALHGDLAEGLGDVADKGVDVARRIELVEVDGQGWCCCRDSGTGW